MVRLNPPLLLRKLEEGDSMAVAHEMLALLRHFENEPIVEPSPELSELLNLVCNLFVRILASEKFVIPSPLAPEFIRHNTTLANVMRLSNADQADQVIQSIGSQIGNLAKILTLYSPDSALDIDIAAFFSADRYLASLWVAAILRGRWWARRRSYDFVNDMLVNPALKNFTLSGPGYPVTEDACFAFFDVTYASFDHERAFRDIINAQVQKDFVYAYHNPNPDFQRILIVSAFFYQGHAVYRCLAPLIASLKPDYQVDLFYLGVEHHDKINHALFDTVHTTGAKDYSGVFTYEMLQRILDHNYGTMIITDVGLSRPSLIHANLRLAPIQITTYGHPVTSGKAKIDYFIGGRDVEPQSNPRKHFEETPVLMPGLGVEPVKSDYVPTFPPLAEAPIEIGLSWGEMKFTYPHLARFKAIQQATKKKIRYNILGISPQRLTYLTAKRDLEDFFGSEFVRVTPRADNTGYMQMVEGCHLMLDSHHFGSYTRVVDSLWCKKPFITLEGEKSYQRLAAALLRQCDLSELVAQTPDAFIALALRWVEDDAFRRRIAAKLETLDLERDLFQTGNARYFKTAIDAIIQHHQGRGCGDASISIL